MLVACYRKEPRSFKQAKIFSHLNNYCEVQLNCGEVVVEGKIISEHQK